MKRKLLFVALLFSVLALLVACGGNDEADNNQGNNDTGSETQNEGDNNNGDLEGNVRIDGSSTVYPIMEAISEEYTKANPNVRVPVGTSGTGGGFRKLTNGEIDIADASRPIKDEEKQALEEAGIEWVDFPIAYDGLTVVINNDNDWVDYLTIDELKKMWLADGNVETWADVREGWPEEPISFYSPGMDSGTYDYWNEVILEDEQMRKDVQFSEDDNVLVQGVLAEKGAISFFGYAYYYEYQNQLRAVPIVNSNGDAVTPSSETIMDGSYEPLSRPLFIYVNKESLKNPAVYDYIKYVFEKGAPLVEEVGYISLNADEYEANLKKLEEAAK